MTTGTWGVFIDSYNHSGKNWSGADSPKEYAWDHRGRRYTRPRVYTNENTYSSSGSFNQHLKYAHWGRVSGQWIKVGRTYQATLCPALNVAEPFAALNAQASVSDLEARALAKLADNVLGTEFHMGNALGTLHQTLGSVASLSVGVLRAHREVKNGNVDGAIKALIRGLSGAMLRDRNRHLNRQRGRLRKQLEEDLNRLNKTKALVQYIERDILAIDQKIARLEGLLRISFSQPLATALLKARKARSKLIRRRNALTLDHGISEVTLKDVSATWLSMQYAWLPMVKDVWEGAQFLDAEFDRQQMVFKGNSKVYASGITKTGAALQRPQWYGRHQVEIRAHLKRQPSVADRLGLTDPLSVVWELIPFSFIVDWFVQVGDWLRSRSVLPLLQTTGWRTRFLLAASKNGNHFPYPGTDPAYDPWAHDGMVYTNGVFDERSVNLSRELLTLSDVRPSTKSLSQAFSLPHIKNAAALIHQQLV